MFACSLRLICALNYYLLILTYMYIDANMGDLVQREHPENWGGIGLGSGAHKTCRSSETAQDGTKVTITD